MLRALGEMSWQLMFPFTARHRIRSKLQSFVGVEANMAADRIDLDYFLFSTCRHKSCPLSLLARVFIDIQRLQS